MPRNDDVRFTSSRLKIPRSHLDPPRFNVPFFSESLTKAKNSLSQLVDALNNRSSESTPSESAMQKLNSAAARLVANSPLLCLASVSLSRSTWLSQSKAISNSPLLCSSSLSLSQSTAESGTQSETTTQQLKEKGQSHSASRYDEERVLISEVLVRNKDGEELERKDLEMEALAALKACRANSALTVREVQEDVHRIISSGYFNSCMPVAVDTRDGIRLVFQVCLRCI